MYRPFETLFHPLYMLLIHLPRAGQALSDAALADPYLVTLNWSRGGWVIILSVNGRVVDRTGPGQWDYRTVVVLARVFEIFMFALQNPNSPGQGPIGTQQAWKGDFDISSLTSALGDWVREEHYQLIRRMLGTWDIERPDVVDDVGEAPTGRESRLVHVARVAFAVAFRPVILQILDYVPNSTSTSTPAPAPPPAQTEERQGKGRGRGRESGRGEGGPTPPAKRGRDGSLTKPHTQ